MVGELAEHCVCGGYNADKSSHASVCREENIQRAFRALLTASTPHFTDNSHKFCYLSKFTAY